MESDISIESVTKVFRVGIFRKKTAVDNVSFSVPRGEILGLLGPNGSGKSTIMKMILGFLQPTQGRISIRGFEPNHRQSRSLIGYLPENPRFQRFLTGNEVLNYYGKLLSLSGVELKSRIEYLLKLVRLEHAAGERTQGYSKGMIQRLAVAQSLLSKPPVLIFDEPMSGLDPLGRMSIREIIEDIHAEFPSTTIFFSTHVLSDVEQLCTSVLLLKNGKLRKHCSISELLRPGQESVKVILTDLPGTVLANLRQNYSIKETPLGVTVTIDPNQNLVEELKTLFGTGAHIVGVSSQRRNLEVALFGDEKNAAFEEAQS